MRPMTDLAPTPQDVGLDRNFIVVAPANGEVLYRIIADSTPKVHDFLSKRDKHDPQMSREHWLLYIGLSMFADQAQAEETRDRFKPDQHIAEVELRRGRGFTLARTFRTPGHHTVWGRPEDLLAAALDYRA
jgi:hypothetical protein